MHKKKTISLSPSPKNLLQSLRDIGYSLETAVADIIDNSITAGASMVDIRFDWNEASPWVAIIDDGHGMDNDTLIESMRFGSIDPRQVRAENDLGRFGLGMKTASISQCRLFTVVSKQNDKINICEWDLDYLASKKVKVQPYILPHHNKVSKEDYKKYGGREGYLHNQGFYIYRNNRLIIKGSWFRLIKKEELNKLIRIRVDIPNTLDHLWGIDVKKSKAIPPKRVKDKLSQIIHRISDKGKRVYRRRGSKLASKVLVPAWERIISDNGISYGINKLHPLVQSFSEGLDKKGQSVFNDIVVMLENTFPKDVFFNDVASEPENVKKNVIPDEIIIDIFEMVKKDVPKEMTLEKKIEWLLEREPFSSYIELTKDLVKKEFGNE